MANPAEKFPLPGLPPENEGGEVTDDMIISEEPIGSSEVEESLAELKKIEKQRQAEEGKEVEDALKDLKRLDEERPLAEGKAEAARLKKEADAEIKAKIAEKHAEGKEAMKKKMAADKNKANMAELRSKLADVKAGKTQETPMPIPPGFEKPAGMSDEFIHDLSRSKDFVASGLLPEGFTQQYEQAYYGVKNAADEVENAGFFKKFSLKRKLKKAMKQLDAMQNEMATHKLDAIKDKKAAAKAVELAAMSPEERAAYDKKQEIDEKRWAHRQGMKQ